MTDQQVNNEPPNFLIWLEAQGGLETYLDLACNPITEHLAISYVEALNEAYKVRIEEFKEIVERIKLLKKATIKHGSLRKISRKS